MMAMSCSYYTVCFPIQVNFIYTIGQAPGPPFPPGVRPRRRGTYDMCVVLSIDFCWSKNLGEDFKLLSLFSSKSFNFALSFFHSYVTFFFSSKQ